MGTEQQPEDLNKPGSQSEKFKELAANAAADQWPGAVRLGKFVKNELAATKRGWALFLVLSCFLVWATWWLFGVFHDRKVEDLKAQVVSTNAYYSGVVANLKESLDKLEKEKEVIKDERDKAQAELAPWIQLANSQLTNTPLTKRMDAFFEKVQLLTELPTFEIIFNDRRITNNSVILLGTNKTITLSARNLSKTSVARLQIGFSAPLFQTNLQANGWVPRGNTVKQQGDEFVRNSQFAVWWVEADAPFPPDSVFGAPPITIQTNVSAGVMPFRVTVFSDKSTASEASALLILE